jgi:hypothetical protein
MIVQITGDTGGTEPYDIFLCDPNNSNCFYISGLTTIPGTVYINTSTYFPNETFLYLRIVDNSGCVYQAQIDCGIQKAFQDLVFFNFMDGVGYILQ